MNIYAVVDLWGDEGVWISEDDPETLLFATLELAEENKLRMDAVELKAHEASEAKRYERWNRMNAARAILEANNFEDIQGAIPGNREPFVPSEFKSKTQILTLQVQDH